MNAKLISLFLNHHVLEVHVSQECESEIKNACQDDQYVQPHHY